MQYNKHNLTPINHSKINPKHSDMHGFPPSSAALQPSLQPPPNISITWPNSRQIRKNKKLRWPKQIQDQINQHTLHLTSRGMHLLLTKDRELPPDQITCCEVLVGRRARSTRTLGRLGALSPKLS